MEATIMKKMLAVMVVCVTLFSSTLCAFASNNTAAATPSRDWNDLAEKYKNAELNRAEAEAKNEELQKQIKELDKKLNAAIKVIEAREKKDNEGHGSRTDPKPQKSDARGEALKRNNAIDIGGTVVGQGGHVEINGKKSSVTFIVSSATGGVLTSAYNQASKVGGTFLACFSTSSPGASFKTAKVNFFVSGATDNDTIAAYQLQGRDWVQVPAQSYKDHVVVDITQHAPIVFIRVPAVAAATN